MARSRFTGIDRQDLYHVCNRESWCGSMDCMQYEYLLSMCDLFGANGIRNEEILHEMAKLIVFGTRKYLSYMPGTEGHKLAVEFVKSALRNESAFIL